jgi:hypothetical protein
MLPLPACRKSNPQHIAASRAGILEWFLLAVIAFGLMDIWADIEMDFGWPIAILRLLHAVKAGR